MTAEPTRPLVSVIVPTKNSGDTIGLCLNSVRRQSYDNTEIIVVDNFSQDDTVRKAKRVADRVFQKRSERSPAKNHGARRAHGLYIMFLDSDMAASPSVLEECVEAATSADACIIPQTTIGRNFWGRCATEGLKPSQHDRTKEAPRFLNRKVFLDLGGYNENLVFGEDKDLQRRALARGLRIARTKSPLLHIDDSSLVERTRRYMYYGRHIPAYLSQTRDYGSLQPFRAFYWRNLGRITRPIHFAGFLLLKLIEYEAYLIARAVSS